MDFPSTFVETSLWRWRIATFDVEGFPASLNFINAPELDLTGAIFQGRVKEVNNTLDLAFIDLGDGREGILDARRARLIKKGRSYSISDSVSVGDNITVQIVHDPRGRDGKLPNLTPRPKISGRYCIVEAGHARLNFSKDLSPQFIKDLTPKLEEFATRAAIIIRSRAKEIPVSIVAAEAKRLTDIITGSKDVPGLIYHPDMAETLAFTADDSNSPIYVTGGSNFAGLKAFTNANYPDIEKRLALYRGVEPAFETLGIEEAIEEALSDRIDLPSGGYLQIHETAAMTIVDVNMGSAYKTQDAAEAKLQVNAEAALALAFHLKFQNIGGLIIVDFINMTGKGRIKSLMDTLSTALVDDDIPVQHTNMSQFGIVEIQRARRGDSLKNLMTVPQPAHLRADTVALDLIRQTEQLGLSGKPGDIVITAPENCIKWLEGNKSLIHALETECGRKINFTVGKADVKLEPPKK